MVYKPTALPLSYECESTLGGNRTHDLQLFGATPTGGATYKTDALPLSYEGGTLGGT